MEEIWKDIDGYEGLYQVSNLGRIKSLYRITCIDRHIPEKILRPALSRGYLGVALHKNMKQKTFTIHRLVAIAFLPKIENKTHVNHKDGNKLNNNVENLEWCSQLENNRHCFDVLGKMSWRMGMSIKPINAKQIIQIDKITNNEICKYESLMDAERKTGIQFKNIHKVCNNKRKTAGGFKWRYSI